MGHLPGFFTSPKPLEFSLIVWLKIPELEERGNERGDTCLFSSTSGPLIFLALMGRLTRGI